MQLTPHSVESFSASASSACWEVANERMSVLIVVVVVVSGETHAEAHEANTIEHDRIS